MYVMFSFDLVSSGKRKGGVGSVLEMLNKKPKMSTLVGVLCLLTFCDGLLACLCGCAGEVQVGLDEVSTGRGYTGSVGTE